MVELFNRCLENREKNGLSPFIRIGNQTSAYVSASRPFEFAVEHGFSAFEWFSDRKSAGWCEADTDLVTRQRWRQVAIDHDIAFIKDDPLADEGKRISNLPNLSAQESRKQMRTAVEKFYTLPASMPMPVPGAS